LFTGSNISRDLPGGAVFVSAVVYIFHYFQKLSPAGDVVVSAVVYRFKYSRKSHLGLLLYLLFFTCSNISRNSHLGLLLLYLLLLTGVVVYAIVHMSQYFQELSTGDEVAISAAVIGL
jgi:hypothetical protein